jgi:outer membrane murein-binding lipoprotein Lpp
MCIATVVLAILLLHGCVSTPPQDVAAPEVIAQLSAQAEAWDKAIVHKDRAAIEQNIRQGQWKIVSVQISRIPD